MQQKSKVLVIDDEVGIRQSMKLLLSSEDYDIILAGIES